MPYLPETVASIQAQTFADWEYVIVDDASDDETVSWVQSAAKRDSRIRLVRQAKQGGPFVAANAGFREARGEYIARTDADDLQPPHRLQRQLDFLAEHRQFRACITPWHSFSSNCLIPGTASIIPTRPAVLRWYLLLRAFASHSSLFIQRAALNEIGGYAELPVAADFRLISALSRKGWLGVIAEVLSYVRRHDKRLSRSQGPKQLEMAVATMADHFKEIADVVWSPRELEDLWLAGHGESPDLTLGILAIRRWSLLWHKDQTLDSTDRRSLDRFEGIHTWNLVRAHLRRQPRVALPYGVKLCLFRPFVLLGFHPDGILKSLIARCRGNPDLQEILRRSTAI